MMSLVKPKISLCRIAVLSLAKILLLLVITPIALASSIRQLHITDVAEAAELIFVGSVVHSESRIAPRSNRIRTWITFRISNVVKGTTSSDSITLGFAGGRVGSYEQFIEGMRYPQIGERGVYFVESVSRPLVNPIVGWSQGHFKSLPSDSGDIVVSADSLPIERVDFSRQKNDLEASLLSRGTALGVNVTDEDEGAITEKQFVLQIRQYLNPAATPSDP